MKLPYSYAARCTAAPAAGVARPHNNAARRRPSTALPARGRPRSAPALFGIAVLAFGLLVSSHPVVPASAAAVPSFDHIFLIVMENHAYSQIIGSSSAPYLN